ncbi:hypothetical protein DPMN_121853 [Dreissena polymorpha]|uniref:Uncharacterized protein n=1 Tax=Dreissena polymorpha TaxID=45954 RepID=A0A9D4GRA7_DREPO|nr:hypothetical protein DPMN_121853 [Dreissena polymorpha]
MPWVRSPIGAPYVHNNGDEANTNCDSERGCELPNGFKEPLVKRSTLQQSVNVACCSGHVWT